MCEPAPSAQPFTEQDAARVDSGSATVPDRSPAVFIHPSPEGKATPRTGSPFEDGHRSLDTEVVQLRQAMQTRPTIDQACGILMATFGLTPQAAWSVLVTISQNTNTKLHLLASDLVASVQGDPLPEVVQQQLAAAVAKTKAAPSS